MYANLTRKYYYMTDTRGQKSDPYLKSPKAFHLEMPLYHEYNISDNDIAEAVYNCLMFDGKIDAYCIWCKKESIFDTHSSFSVVSKYVSESNLSAWIDRGDLIKRVVHKCNRNKEHEYFSYYIKDSQSFRKFGQWPSVADFQIPQVEKYRNILGDEQYKELTKGIGLASHGVGIGAFPYLRRIFENLIEESHLLAKKDSSEFREEYYEKARIVEKIILLKDFLPEFLVKNRVLYAILSKGIHELTENDCLLYFEVVKTGIEQILDEKIHQKEKSEKAAKAGDAIQKIYGDIAKLKN